MSELRRKMIEDMELRGLKERTQECYASAVKQLAEYYHRSPEKITDEEVRRYFFYLIRERNLAPKTIKQKLNGIRFLYVKTIGRDFPTLEFIRPAKRRRLPVVLTQKEVRLVLGKIRRPTQRMCLTTIYACGLRLREGTGLRISDIDGQRQTITVREGKGGKDRQVPIANRLLELLRTYWKRDRPRGGSNYLFPRRDGEGQISPATIQRAMKSAVAESGIVKDAHVHTLRHSWATQLLECGADIKIVQKLLGHQSAVTTGFYHHLTRNTLESFHEIHNRLMAEL